jgi:hypothetical protein
MSLTNPKAAHSFDTGWEFVVGELDPLTGSGVISAIALTTATVGTTEILFWQISKQGQGVVYALPFGSCAIRV